MSVIPVFETSIEEPFHPEATAYLGDLRGPEGNAWFIMGAVAKALQEVGVDPKEYQEAAMGGDYENLVFVSRSWVRTIEVGPGLPSDQDDQGDDDQGDDEG